MKFRSHFRNYALLVTIDFNIEHMKFCRHLKNQMVANTSYLLLFYKGTTYGINPKFSVHLFNMKKVGCSKPQVHIVHDKGDV